MTNSTEATDVPSLADGRRAIAEYFEKNASWGPLGTTLAFGKQDIQFAWSCWKSGQWAGDCDSKFLREYLLQGLNRRNDKELTSSVRERFKDFFASIGWTPIEQPLAAD